MELTNRGDDGGAAVLGGDEAMLDAEYITAMGANISTEFWGFQGKEYVNSTPCCAIVHRSTTVI